MTCVFHCHLQNICSRKKGNFSPCPKSSGRAWKKIEAVASKRKKKKLTILKELKALALKVDRGLRVSTGSWNPGSC